MIVGNHDVPYKNNNDVNAIKELFGNSTNYYEACSLVDFGDGIDHAIIPWINSSN